jgi:phosphoribosylformylglycinamidine cyclo-ligase
MNVNDVICVGAEPVCMVDYLAMDKMDYEIAKEIAAGIYVGAEQAGIAVIGGETATLPEMICGIGEKGFDLAAAVIGLVDKDKIITGEKIRVGDKVLGFQSSGIHSNGLTLARKVLPKSMWINILTPTKIYVKDVLNLLSEFDIHGMANITGGGFLNLTRLCEHGFRLDNLPEPQVVFKQIQKQGNVSTEEMYRTFNMGVGFTLIAERGTSEEIIEKYCSDYQISIIGEVVEEAGVKLILDEKEYLIK